MTVVGGGPELVVEPAYLSIPDRLGTYGDIVADVADLARRPLDPEQRIAVDAICSYTTNGRWAALESCLIQGRQNGKTAGIVLPIVLTDLFIWEADKIAWTAHLFRTTRDSFLDVKQIIEGTPEFSRRVKKIREANGEEGVELMSGARLDFMARSKGGGRGLGGKRVVLDEALFLAGTTLGALIPTLSARPNPQVMYASSAGLAESEHLRALRDRGRLGTDPSLVYVEWSTPRGGCRFGDKCTHAVGVGGCALDDENNWRRSNPAIPRRISVEFVRSERLALPPREFARERAGWWDEPDVVDVPLNVNKWQELTDKPKRRPRGIAPVFFLDVSPGMASASINVAYERKRKPHLELADHRPGTAGFVDRCKQLARRFPDATWGAEAAGAIGALLPDLSDAGIEPELFGQQDMGRAAGHIQRLVEDGDMTHDGDDAYTVAINGAVKRDVGEGLWAWGRRKSTTDISPLVGGTGALWLLETVGSYDPLDHLH